MIAVGRCPNSDGLQFLNPANGTIISSFDYTFLHRTTSGTHFGYTYQPGTFIYRLDETTTIHQPKFALDSTVLIHTHSPPHVAKIIGLPSYDRPDIYTVLFADGSISEYSNQANIIEASSVHEQLKQYSLLPSWVQNDTNATLFLSNMTKPHHGKLYLDTTNQWVFCPGNSKDISTGIQLPDLSSTIQTLLDTGQIFRGHTKFKRVYNTRHQVQLRDSILRHVSAHGLTSLLAPTSLKARSLMSSSDKVIWDEAYLEECDSLSSLPR